MVTPLQSAGASSDTWSGGLAFTTANCSAGTKLIAYTVNFGNSTVTAVKDAALNSMTKLASVSLGGASANGELALWAMDTPAADVGIKPVLTPSGFANNTLSMVIQEVPGLLAGNTSAMLDGSVVGSSGTLSANGNAAAGALTTAAAGEFLVAVGGDDEISTNTWGVPTGSITYTRDANAQNATFITDCIPAYGSSSGGAETASFALTGVSGSNHWGVLFAAFKLAPLAAPYTPPVAHLRPPGRRSPAVLSRMRPAQVPFPPDAGGDQAPSLEDAAAAVDDLSTTGIQAAVPLGDLAGATEALSATVTTSASDVAGATDSLSVTVSVPLADQAAAVEASTATVAASLADLAGAVDAPAVSAAVPLADLAAAADTVAVSQPIPQADVAAAADALAATAAVPLSEVAGAADSLTATVSASASEAAASLDAVAIAAATPLPDVAAAIESSTVTAAVPLADKAGAAETLTASVTAPLTDVAGAVDSITVDSSQPVSLADSGAATEALAATAAVPLAEKAAAADQVAVSAAVPLADVAAATDAISVVQGNQAALAETGAATDSLGITASTALADAGGAAEALTVAAAAGLAEVAGAVDAISVVAGAAIPLGDAAGALDTLQVAVSVPLSEVAAAADRLVPVVTLAFSDFAGSVESVSVFTGILVLPKGIWHVQPEALRWRAEPDQLRWQADANPGRWELEPVRARWTAQPETGRWRAEMSRERWAAQPEPARWRIMMTAFDPISALSLENIPIRWTSDLDGQVIDPTSLVCQYALPVSSGNPLAPAQPVTWFTGTWLAPGTSRGKGYVQLCPVGPTSTGPVLVVGQKYDVWGFIQGSPEQPKKFAGTITVY